MLKNLLSNPGVYGVFNNFVVRFNHPIYKTYVSHETGARVLDIGCGVGTTAARFLDADYTGVDFSPEYIESANRYYAKYPNIRFVCQDISAFCEEVLQSGEAGKFDLIIMEGVLHHLSDEEVDTCLGTVRRMLKQSGTFRSRDGAFRAGQPALARIALEQDRGDFVRTEEGYLALMKPHFKAISYQITSKLLRIPYTEIMFCNAIDEKTPLLYGHTAQRPGT